MNERIMAAATLGCPWATVAKQVDRNSLKLCQVIIVTYIYI